MRAWLGAIAFAVVTLLCGGSARADERVVLRIAMAYLVEADADVVRRQAARFSAAHPGVDVEVVGKTERRTPQHDLWARYLALGDPSIDVYVIDEPWIDEFAFAGWIRPLDELDAWARADLHPAGLRSGRWRDHLYAVPTELSANALFYRPQWLADAGLAPPKTLEALLADARSLANERHLRYGLVLHTQALFNDVNPLLWGSGGGPLQAGAVRLDDPVHVDVFTALRAEVGGALAPAAELRAWRAWPSDYHAAVDAFGAGDAAFMINWLRFRPAGLARGAYGIAPIPGLAGHAPGSGATLGSWFWAVNAASVNPSLAIELVRFLSSEDATLERFEAVGAFPPLARFYDDPKWAARFPDLVVARAAFANAQPRMAVTDEHGVDAIVDRAYADILLDGAPVAATLAAASAAANADLAAFPAEELRFDDAGPTEPSGAHGRRSQLVVVVAIVVWALAAAMALVGVYLGRRRGGLFQKLATKVSVLGLTAVLLALTTGTAVALRVLVTNQEDAIAEEQSIFRAGIREHAASLGRQIALDASVLRDVTSVGATMIRDARSARRGANGEPEAASDVDDLTAIEGAFHESLELLAAEGAYGRDILFLQLLDSDGAVVVDDKTFLAGAGGRGARRVVDDPKVRALARYGRRMSMRDVPASGGRPPYLEVMVPLIQSGRQAGAVHIGYSKAAQEARIASLSARQEQVLKSAVSLVTLAAIGLVALATALLRLFARSVAQPLVSLSDLAARVGGGDLSVRADVGGRDEVSALAKRLNGMVEGLRERQAIRETLGRYVGPSVSEAILAGHVELGGEERAVTILFSDLRGFTTIAEPMQPQEVVRLLNAYFERMVDAVFEHDGMLDKFIGDGLMAVFGAPSAVVDHAMHAVSCALEMRRRLVEVNRALAADGMPALKIGIGLHTGQVVVGNIGSSKRMEYTAIGDAVNLASRLESQTKDLGVDILMSEATYAAVADRVVADRLGEVQVKGKNKVVVVYALRGIRDAQRSAPPPPA